MRRAAAHGAALALLLAPAAALASGSEEGPAAHVWEWLNLVLMLGVLIYFARKPVASFLAERRGGIERDLHGAEQLLRDAEARLAEWRDRAARLDGDVADIKRFAREAAQQDAARIVAEAHAVAERIRRDAASAVEREAQAGAGAPAPGDRGARRRRRRAGAARADPAGRRRPPVRRVRRQGRAGERPGAQLMARGAAGRRYAKALFQLACETGQVAAAPRASSTPSPRSSPRTRSSPRCCSSRCARWRSGAQGARGRRRADRAPAALLRHFYQVLIDHRRLRRPRGDPRRVRAPRRRAGRRAARAGAHARAPCRTAQLERLRRALAARLGREVQTRGRGRPGRCSAASSRRSAISSSTAACARSSASSAPPSPADTRFQESRWTSSPARSPTS